MRRVRSRIAQPMRKRRKAVVRNPTDNVFYVIEDELWYDRIAKKNVVGMNIKDVAAVVNLLLKRIHRALDTDNISDALIGIRDATVLCVRCLCEHGLPAHPPGWQSGDSSDLGFWAPTVARGHDDSVRRAIESELEYRGWRRQKENEDADDPSIESEANMMGLCMIDAVAAGDDETLEKALASMRHAAALGVRCMMNHGAPLRKWRA